MKKTLLLFLSILFCLNSFSQNIQTFNQRLLDDLENPNYIEVAEKWIKLYDELPEKHKNTIYTKNGTFKMDYGNFYGLYKGFSWTLCDKYENYEIMTAIAEHYWNWGEKSKKEETKGYRAGMVVMYIINHVLCLD